MILRAYNNLECNLKSSNYINIYSILSPLTPNESIR